MYIKQMALCGCVLMIEKYHTYRYKNTRQGRSERKNQTTEQQKAINARHAARKRVMTACTNFHHGDYFLRLGYYSGEKPDSTDAAHKKLCEFLKKCKRKYPNLKYMGTTERGSKGGIHHHILVPADFDMNLLKKWQGSAYKTRTYTEELSQLASYFTKGECCEMFEETREHTERKKKYTASRNLKKPEIEKKIIKKTEHWSDTPRSMTYKGKIYDFKPGSNRDGFTRDGYEYQHYIMIERRGAVRRE